MQNTAHEELKIVTGITPRNLSAASAVTSYIDTLGFNELLAILEAGSAATGGALSALLQGATTLALASAGTFTTITGALFTRVTPSNHKKTFVGRMSLQNCPRYVRGKLIGTGATAKTIVGMSIILSRARTLPVTQENTVAFNITDASA